MHWKIDDKMLNEIQFDCFFYYSLYLPNTDDIRRSKESLLIHTKPYFGYNEQKIDTNSVKPAKQYQPIRSTTLPPPTTTITPTTTIRYHIPERYIQSTTTTTTTAQPYLSTRLPPQPKSLANSKFCHKNTHAQQKILQIIDNIKLNLFHSM